MSAVTRRTIQLPSDARRVALYARVSSDEQREKQTILTQEDVLNEAVERAGPGVRVVGRFFDDGVSGTVPFEARVGGRRLLEACQQGLIDEVWITKVNRLARRTVITLQAVEAFDALGVKLVGILEAVESKMILTVMAAVAEEDRRSFLENSKYGMQRAAREGRYCGGIVPLGYRVEGVKQNARLVVDDTPFWHGKSAAEVVRWMYEMAAVEHLSCYGVADRLNELGVPTHYARDARLVGNARKGQRKKATTGLWRPSRVRLVLTNTTYRGEQRYGKLAAAQGRGGVISAPCPRIVSDELWEAAQETRRAHRLPSTERATRRRYLLKSLIRCGECGLRYSGSWHARDGVAWYSCGGRQRFRSKWQGKCPGKQVNGNWLEPQILDDIARFLREPGDILDELEAEVRRAAGRDTRAEEIGALQLALGEFEERHKRLVHLLVRGLLSEADYEDQQTCMAQERAGVEARLVELAAAEPDQIVTGNLREELARRLDAGLTEDQLFEIVGYLVAGITVYTPVGEDGNRHLRIVIEYRYPGRVLDHTGTGYTPRGA
ncbi:recombinase family protein [bacterium]|nr:recombinase family protein [bacterium]